MQRSKIYDNEEMMGRFNLVSASLYNFLPQINFKEHEIIFRQIMLHQKDSIINQKNFNSLEKSKIIGLELVNNSYKVKQSIFCTFHIGSYRLINLFLIKNKVEYTLVVSKKLLEAQGDTFVEFYINQNNFKEGGFDVIDADSSTSTMNMIRHLKNGRSLLIYTDGNLGVGIDAKKSRNTCLISFMSQKIYARSGVAYLSHLLGIPIIRVFSYKNSINEDVIKFEEIICPQNGISKSEYAHFVTSKLYKKAEELITRNPGQWEGWLYLHKIAVVEKENLKCINKSNCTSHVNLSFNEDDFGLFKIGSNCYLFQKCGYKSYYIKEDLYKLLLENIKNGKSIQNFDKDILQDFVKKRVLININAL
jgi:lauroyl/myristoyl acyltransferase